MLNYEAMNAVLTELHGKYPSSLPFSSLASLPDGDEGEKLLFYLREHEMISMQVTKRMSGKLSVGEITITAKGIDFLQDDGGLGARAAPCVRITGDSLASIIDIALMEKDVSAGDRIAIQQSVRMAGAESIKALVQRLVNEGITHAPDILGFFRSL